jgi:hypothetical protein
MYGDPVESTFSRMKVETKITVDMLYNSKRLCLCGCYDCGLRTPHTVDACKN